MFPQGSQKRNYPLRPGSLSTLFLSLPALYWSEEKSLKRSKNTGEKKGVSGHCTTETQPLHCFTLTHTHTITQVKQLPEHKSIAAGTAVE